MKEFSFFLFTLNILIPKYKKIALKTKARFLLFFCFLIMMSLLKLILLYLSILAVGNYNYSSEN